MVTTRFRKSAPSEQAVLNRVEVTLLDDDPAQRARLDSLVIGYTIADSVRVTHWVTQFDFLAKQTII